MSVLSFSNPKVQHLRRLLGRRSARHGEELFVVEGSTLAAGAVAAGWVCRSQFVPEGTDGVAGAGPVEELGVGVLERVGSTTTPQPPLVVVEMRRPSAADVLAASSFVVVLDRLQDPGNLGTILRSAEAAGAEAVVLTPGSVDAFSPKTVRASAGALFHVPVVTATLEEAATAGLVLVGSSSHESLGRTVVDHTDADLTGRIGLVLGNEAAGLDDRWTDVFGPIARWVTIRHRGRAESLNVAMAATVLVFEAARRREAL